MTGYSSIRARHAQNNIEATEILGPEATARLRAAVAPETWRRIEEASRLEWLPVELDIEVLEVGSRVFGVENNHARVRAGLKRTIEGPLLKALLEGAANLFGIRPSSLFRF